jgi:hypothetical protein
MSREEQLSRIKELIKQQMGIIKSEIIAARDKEWIVWVEKTFEITKVCTDCAIGTKSCISRWCTYGDVDPIKFVNGWQKRKRELGL